MLGTHACTAELGRDLIRQRQAEGIAVKRNHGGNVGGRPRVADVKADAAVKLYIARETPIPDICARLGLAQNGRNSPVRHAQPGNWRYRDGIALEGADRGTDRPGGDVYSLYRVEGSAFGDFTCYRVGRAPYNGTLYLPAGFHDYGIATLRGLFAALEGGQCEFLCEYQDEIDGVYHGLFEKRI